MWFTRRTNPHLLQAINPRSGDQAPELLLISALDNVLTMPRPRPGHRALRPLAADKSCPDARPAELERLTRISAYFSIFQRIHAFCDVV
jgi:hypothetical protein